MEKILKDAYDEGCKYFDEGAVASYIPELSDVNKNQLGICVISDKGVNNIGDFDARFTIQSIVKPFILMLALMDNGIEKVSATVGVEATGKPFDAFNYSDQALKKEHINPMINAGAITLCTLIKGKDYNEKFLRLLDLIRKMSKNSSLEVNQSVYKSEKHTGNKNRALTYMLKAYNLIEDDAEEVLDFYFKACSIEVTCQDLANLGKFLATREDNGEVGRQLIKYINAVLATSGMYDGSGRFATKVGIPAKSGVGGGIMAVVPDRMGIGIFSPGLDKKGNSLSGIKVLEYLSEKLDLSIF